MQVATEREFLALMAFDNRYVEHAREKDTCLELLCIAMRPCGNTVSGLVRMYTPNYLGRDAHHIHFYGSIVDIILLRQILRGYEEVGLIKLHSVVEDYKTVFPGHLQRGRVGVVDMRLPFNNMQS